MKHIVERARAKRRRLGFSLREVEIASGISFSTLARLERGDGGPSKATERRLHAWVEGGEFSDPRSIEERLVRLEAAVGINDVLCPVESGA
ncbi:hypothetical protein LCGC14_1433670 [marine sediment metagenome]|uniref:HTH cro/C1-type domain-containing protein n=1 Tax=marine sediment metagenome TaxID=412755 RepID=A0A0F9JN99_9ZZZZ